MNETKTHLRPCSELPTGFSAGETIRWSTYSIRQNRFQHVVFERGHGRGDCAGAAFWFSARSTNSFTALLR